MSAATDSFGKISFDMKERQGITNLLQILSLLSGRPQSEVNAEWEGKEQYGAFKAVVADAVCDFLIGFQERLSATPERELLQKLEHSEQAMSQVANEALLRVQKAVGLRQ